MVKNKTILHIDGDAFFVGVEIAKNPKLRGLPVVTGEERGIVSALSYEAKALGVTRGMPIFQIKKRFPTVVILPGDYKAYVAYSRKMFAIVRRYVDDVEEYSIDECFADLTGLDKPLKMSYLEIAQRIKKEINDEMDLSVSIGIAPTKVLAKIASNWVKPNGLTVIDPNNIIPFLEKTPIGKIWGIGPRTANFLMNKGISYAIDFTSKELPWIQDNLSKPYEVIWQELNGVYRMILDPKKKSRFSSIQKTRTFHPSTNDKVFLFSQLSKNIEDACAKARHYKLFPKKISFFLRNKDLVYVTSSIHLSVITNTPESLIRLVEVEFDKIHKKGVLYRTTGFMLQDLNQDISMQGNLFGERDTVDKFESVHKSIDLLENKIGKKMVYLASSHNAHKVEKKGTDSEDFDTNLLFL